MLRSMPQPLTFSSFLTGMSSLLCNVSSRGDLISAFATFEGQQSGLIKEPPAQVSSSEELRIHVDELKEMLLESGMDARDLDKCFAPFLKAGGLGGDWFYYGDFVNMMRGGNTNDE